MKMSASLPMTARASAPILAGVRMISVWSAFAALVAVTGCVEDKMGAGQNAEYDSTLHFGCCDASAGVAVSTNLFAVANDEDNLLRIYQRDASGLPVQSFPLERVLGVDPRKPESDIEASARVGDLVFWITSHGRNRDAEIRESRQRFFATRFSVTNGRVEMEFVGEPYANVLDDLVREPRLSRFNLGRASARAPKRHA
jgi:hypothetical protein